MGYIRHHAILVTTQFDDCADEAAARALEIFSPGHVRIMDSGLNGFRTLFVGPDGSKEGWEESAEGDSRRGSFVSWLESQHYDDGSSPYEWVEVQYGDDNYETKIVRDSDEKKRAQP